MKKFPVENELKVEISQLEKRSDQLIKHREKSREMNLGFMPRYEKQIVLKLIKSLDFTPGNSKNISVK